MKFTTMSFGSTLRRALYRLLNSEFSILWLQRSVLCYCYTGCCCQSMCITVTVQRLQNRVLRTTGNFPRRTSVRDLHATFQIPYVYDFITKLCRQQAGVIQNHDNENDRNIGQGEALHRKYRRLKLSGGHVYDRSSV
jgi:hypothetical protein